jgi:peptide deformylase
VFASVFIRVLLWPSSVAFFCGLDCRAYNSRMSILKIARMGHPVLRAKARTVHPSEIRTPTIQELIDDMFETMKEYQGVGLAAPQVHEPLRIFVAGFPPRQDMDEDEEANEDGEDVPLMALINPEIEIISRDVVEDWEGCLSIPDIRGRVQRARQIVVRAFDRSGKKMELQASGFTARVIQHETDHLDGVLFFDRMKTFQSLTFLDEFGRYWSGHNVRSE